MGVRMGAERLGRVGARVRVAVLGAPVSRRRRRAQQSVVPRGAALHRPPPRAACAFSVLRSPSTMHVACRARSCCGAL